MNFESIQKYRTLFFKGNWSEDYLEENQKFMEPLFQRVKFLVKDQIIFNDALDMEPLDEPFSLNKYKWNSYPLEDPEWTFMLSRQGFMVDLAIAYYLTKDQSYINKYKELILAFVRENGQPNNGNLLSWRPLDVGIRLMNWIKSWIYLCVEREFSKRELSEIKESILHHLRFIENSYKDKFDLSNWGVLAITGMASVSLFFDDLVTNGQKSWFRKKLKKQIELQFYKDGVHWEQSPLYHHQVLMAILYIVNIGEYLKIPWAKSLRKDIKKPIEMSVYYANQDDLLLPLHDSDQVDFSYIYDIYRMTGFLKETPSSDKARIYVGSLYHPNENHKIAPLFKGEDSGFYAYKDNDVYFTLFNGLHGSSHGHGTNGSFTLDINNKPLLVDSGRYTYRESKLRYALKSEKAHNTLYIPESPGTAIRGSWKYYRLTEPVFHQAIKTKFGPFFEVAWTGNTDGVFYLLTRKILLINDMKTIVLYDRVESNQEIEVQKLFQLAVDQKILYEKNNEISFGNGRGITRLWFQKGSIEKEEAELSRIYNQKEKHQRITNTFRTKEKMIGNISLITWDPSIKIRDGLAYQNKLIEPSPYIEAVKLSYRAQSLEIYFLNRDVVDGDKLFHTKNEDYFYGQVNIIDELGRVEKIR